MTTPEPANLRDDEFWDAPLPAAAIVPSSPAGRSRPAKGAGSRTARRAERTETRGRARALQALYAADLRDITDLRRIALQVWDDLAIDPAERTFASRVVEVVLDRRAEIDGSLGELTTNWRLDRIGAIERSVLRLGAAELLRGDTPPRVVLQEAIHLAERYGTSRSARFVNGVLDAYARRLGRL